MPFNHGKLKSSAKKVPVTELKKPRKAQEPAAEAAPETPPSSRQAGASRHAGAYLSAKAHPKEIKETSSPLTPLNIASKGSKKTAPAATESGGIKRKTRASSSRGSSATGPPVSKTPRPRAITVPSPASSGVSGRNALAGTAKYPNLLRSRIETQTATAKRQLRSSAHPSKQSKTSAATHGTGVGNEDKNAETKAKRDEPTGTKQRKVSAPLSSHVIIPEVTSAVANPTVAAVANPTVAAVESKAPTVTLRNEAQVAIPVSIPKDAVEEAAPVSPVSPVSTVSSVSSESPVPSPVNEDPEISTAGLKVSERISKFEMMMAKTRRVTVEGTPAARSSQEAAEVCNMRKIRHMSLPNGINSADLQAAMEQQRKPGANEASRLIRKGSIRDLKEKFSGLPCSEDTNVTKRVPPPDESVVVMRRASLFARRCKFESSTQQGHLLGPAAAAASAPSPILETSEVSTPSIGMGSGCALAAKKRPEEPQSPVSPPVTGFDVSKFAPLIPLTSASDVGKTPNGRRATVVPVISGRLAGRVPAACPKLKEAAPKFPLVSVPRPDPFEIATNYGQIDIEGSDDDRLEDLFDAVFEANGCGMMQGDEIDEAFDAIYNEGKKNKSKMPRDDFNIKIYESYFPKKSTAADS